MARTGWGWFVLFGIGACSRAPKPEQGALEPAPSAMPAASASASASVSSAPPTRLDLDCAKVTATQAMGQLLADWNRALNEHDAHALEQVYTSRVSFYGRNLSRAQVLAAKQQALAATPSYKQQLSDVRVAPEADSTASATFDKASARAKTTRGRLLAQCGADQRYALAAESDAPSDALAKGDDCEGAMYRVAFALPEVKRALAGATDDTPLGGLSYPTEGEHVGAAIGYHHPDRFEAAFFLDWDKGLFTINQGDVKVPPVDQARVKAACSVARQ